MPKLINEAGPSEQHHHAKTEETIGMKTLNEVPSRKSLKKEPQLDRENFVNGHIKKFLAHVETREIQQFEPGSSTLMKRAKFKKNDKTCPSEDGSRLSGQNKAYSSDSDSKKDNLDPNDVIK